ncbi:MAG: porin [Burkholderiales bacterium]|jgi:predicted porin|nr:porin [Burkholderiales bacterium]
MKKWMVLGAAALFPTITFAQQSNVSLYGEIELGVFANRALNGVQGGRSVERIDDTTSLFGLRGSEDLGNGLSAIWQIEQAIEADLGKGTLATRDTYLGVKGSWGTVRLGRLSSYLNSDMETMDSWTYAPSGVSGLGIMTRFDGRYNNTVRYDSPSISGFDFSALVSLDETKDRNWTYGLGLGYENSGFFGKAGLVYSKKQDGEHNGYYARIEGGYQSQLSIIGAYQYSKQYAQDSVWSRDSVFGGKVETNEFAVTATYEMGNWTPRASIALGLDPKVNGHKENIGYTQFVLGADYALSKRTFVYGAAGFVQYDKKANADGDHRNESTFGVGMKHTF